MIFIFKECAEGIITKPDAIKLILLLVFCLVLMFVVLKNLFFGKGIAELGEALGAGILCLFLGALLLKGVDQNDKFNDALSVAIEEEYSVCVDGATVDIDEIDFDAYENVSINTKEKQIVILTSEK